ncbi:cupin domain-containing protein [Salinisphaera sp. Q1T1-3]|uniref:cupin domain-containing protein n=1 Tax=Salinisphaera sp. Q1T1-3 TaxID=2321229 RepID=UPI000E734074|nr:cupin domain-containing protein [Salinisphaera sp. Q1T1-3]RJS91844.1 cupin domain-containing protein [Salinisphaera sp. Q1T1-3]
MKTETNDTAQPSATDFDASTEVSVGRRLRRMRKSKGLTVATLGERAAVSAGMISQIERGLSNPSIGTLERLRGVLGIPLTAFFEDRDDRAPATPVAELVRRADQRPFFQVGSNGMSKALLSPSGDHDLQFMIISVPPHTRSHDVMIGPGEKAGLVLEGQLTLTLDERVTVLATGDSFQFDSRKAHGVANESDESVRLLWIMHTKPQQAEF